MYQSIFSLSVARCVFFVMNIKLPHDGHIPCLCHDALPLWGTTYCRIWRKVRNVFSSNPGRGTSYLVWDFSCAYPQFPQTNADIHIQMCRYWLLLVMCTLFNKNQAARYFVRPAQTVTWRTVAMIIRVVLLFVAFLRLPFITINHAAYSGCPRRKGQYSGRS
jgi:hypothetical protein